VRRIALFAFLFLAAAPVGAQIMNVPQGSLAREPGFFLATTVGLPTIQSVKDGRTGTIWDFSQSIEFGAALERSLGHGSAFGIVATYSKVPLHYLDSSVVSTGIANCCNAHVDVVTAGAQFTSGGGVGFHQVIMISLGVIAFQNFDVKYNGSAGSPGAPPQRDIDPRLAVGYGFGYGLSARSEVFLLQEYGVALHQGDGLQGNDRRQYQQQTTRVGFRLGAGSR
jgi:hypothetical protein